MNDHENNPRQAGDDHPDPPRGHGDSGRGEESREDRSSISTTDPTVSDGPGQRAEWHQYPDATLVTETSSINGPVPGYHLPNGGNATGGGSKDRQQQAKGNQAGRDNGNPPRGQDRGRDEGEGREADARRAKPQPSPWRNALISAAVALAAGMLGAGIVVYFFESSKSEGKQSSSDGQSSSQKKSGSESKSKSKGSGKESGKGSGSGSDEISQTGSSIPGLTRADDADALRRQIEHLSERIDQQGHRLDTTSRLKEEVPPDLRTLQIKVGDLSRTMEEVGDLPSRVRRVENRLEETRQEMKSLRDRLSSSRDEGASAAADRKLAMRAVASTPIASTTTTVDARPDAAMAQGIALFKDGNYPEASNIFRKLQITRPDDARVWYYSALSTALTTGDWTQSARELVAHGLECEGAGSPEKDKIDVAFSGLSDAQGRKWLMSYRDQIRR